MATGKVWAIKRLQKAECVRLQQTDHVQSERAVLREMEHPFIVELRGTFQGTTVFLPFFVVLNQPVRSHTTGSGAHRVRCPLQMRGTPIL
jgi:hypothetical protein